MAPHRPCKAMAKQTFELAVGGMTCNNCVAHVTKALEGVPGVKKAKVSLEAASATVTAKPDVSKEALAAAVKAAGYEVKD